MTVIFNHFVESLKLGNVGTRELEVENMSKE